ncbi:Vacuolar sorting protein VPS1, dynamin [Handroanthus impetiginosus]|uniref:Vacuolar sorting protein VPS1, dynamin n=1 Tax=Handroanthus impetiginosus TaxID=429701 RepID=A0A2G9GPR0_9LAMI|nr:Vacuolar sorting protein VPS1, dynamin [Handroanthus impetiginosus]
MSSSIPAEGEVPSTAIDTVSRMSLLNISEEHLQDEKQSLHNAPLVSSYNDKIRPLLGAVDRLRHLKIMQEGIQLPTIVVVGDQSSGKSSVLESLAGISLPRGQGICTRVPLIMRLQSHTSPKAELFLEYDGRVVPTDEEHIAGAIITATDKIAGQGKGISNTPLTLIVKKRGVPDLTMVDLPGITRVPVYGQPEDIYEQISKIIMEYITPEESIILNVLSASVDFSTCESIRMSQRVDKTGQRTLAVVTKVDKAPEGLLEKVTMDDVNIGLGYICVRNRIGDESYEEAREEEAKLFDNHPLLSKMNRSIVGIPLLAERLVKIQATIIVKCLPDIVRKINDKLSSNVEELNKLPRNLTSIGEAMTAFMHILGSAKESLRKTLLRGEFDDYPDEHDMHCTARLAEMLNQYSEELQSKSSANATKNAFLLDVISVLEETKAIGLPNFLPRAAFLTLLQKNVKGISFAPIAFVEKIWDYIEKVVVSVLMRHSDNYPQLLSSTRRAAQNLVSKRKKQSIDWVIDIIEMEKLTDYTCNPEYVSMWNKLMAHQNEFMKALNDHSKPRNLHIDGYGDVDVAHLRSHVAVAQEAFDLKMRLTAYWNVVLRRLVDGMALHLQFSVQNLVNKEMEIEIINEMVGPNGNGLERMLEESPTIAEKRKRLNNSVKLLKEAKDVVSKIIDKIAAYVK